jgi:amino acid adenylation domain-containing protein
MNLSKMPESGAEQNQAVLNDNISPMTPETPASFHPLSLGQQALWFLYQMARESVAYNVFNTALIRSNIDINALNRAWQKVVHRHPILRTTYINYKGRPFQIINYQLECSLQIRDASNWSEEYLKEQISIEIDRTFNLEKDPVVRLNLFTQSAQKHILLLTGHHIAGDLWSSDLIFNELRFWYAAETEQLSPQQIEDSLPKNLPYSQFVHWQSEMLSSPRGEKLWEYWQKQLSGELPILNLPTDRPRPPMQSFRGETHIFRLNEQLIQGLREIARATGTTLYKLMLAAYFALLYRYTNQEDILVGTPMLGRPGREFKGVVGYFVSSVVLRASLSGNLTFKDLLAQLSSTVKEAQRYQDYPFPVLVEKLQPQRDTSRSPLFQVNFTWHKQRWCESGKELGFKMDPYPTGHKPGASFDLDLMVREIGEVIQVCWQYNTDLFDGATIARMAGHYHTLLEAIAANPKQKISELPLLTEIERHQLHVEWNNTWAEYPQDKCIHQLFEEQVERSPDASAVVFEEEQLTYRELNARANQLAHYLQSLGVGPEVLVGICVQRSREMVIGLLGILKAGGAYVPIDPAYPQERLTFILEDSCVSVLLTQAQLIEKLPQQSSRIVYLDFESEEIASQSESNSHSPVTSANLAYAIYTSGSTGKPKGAMNTHQGICNRLLWMQDSYQLTSDDSVLQKTPFSFDVSVWEFFWPLLVGARLVMASPEGHKDPAYLVKAIAQYQITTLHFVPSMLQLFLETPGLKACTCLHQVMCSGEALAFDLVERFFTRLPEVKLHNLYGPTEAAVDVTFWECKPDYQDSIIPIGRPIANTQLYILDSDLQPVPIGVPGELHIGGVGLARGYLNRPDLTDQKFIPNPFSDQPDARLYKTGDLARYLPDGNIEYLGRIDNQVKIRGFRIELGEIEAVLSLHPDVRETAVIATENVALDKQLVAYVVCHQQPTPAISDLRRFLKEKLPEYMVPGAFVVLEALPLTPNGKVDRRALASQKWQSASVAPNEIIAVAPRDKFEFQVTKIWEKVLGINSIGIRDNFFEVGGHSLLAARLLAEIEKVFDKKLPLSAIFQSPTVEQLADILREPEWSSPSPSMVVIQPGIGSYKPPLFCIHALGRGLEFYRPLMNYIDRSQPVLGLSTQIMDEKLAPPNRVEELAAYYIKEMRTFQPHGPYFLLGVSFGGTVAFEMARQLHDLGEKVALLGLLDTYEPAALKNFFQIKKSQPLTKIQQLEPAVFLEKAKSNLSGKIEYLTHIQWRILCKLYRAVGRPLPIYLENFTHGELNTQALIHYVAGVYPGRASIFKAVSTAATFGADRELGWGEVITGGIEVHDIPSDHLGMLKEPHVRILGEKLQACIDRFQGKNL